MCYVATALRESKIKLYIGQRRKQNHSATRKRDERDGVNNKQRQSKGDSGTGGTQ